MKRQKSKNPVAASFLNKRLLETVISQNSIMIPALALRHAEKA
jgi:hypothetical protein